LADVARKADGAEQDRTANLLGALSLVVADRMSDAIAGAAGQSETGAAALSALHHIVERPSIDKLRQVLGLTSSGTVRLVDRLVAAGYVERVPGNDGRATYVALTPSGRRAARRVSAARTAVLDGALASLSPTDRQTLTDLVSRLLVGLMRGPGAQRWMCRLCDTLACGHHTGRCPVINAALATHGGTGPARTGAGTGTGTGPEPAPSQG
jgi:DNA-binding MarR family transcriptional regulator